MKNSIAKKIYFSLGILFIFVIWIVGEATFKNSYVIPSVLDTFKALGNLFTKGHTYKVLGYTLLRLITSISICFLLGILLAVLSYKFKGFKWFIKPLITLLKTLPIAVVIILLLFMLSEEYAHYYQNQLLRTHHNLLFVGTWNGSTGTLTTLPITNPATGIINAANKTDYTGFDKILTVIHHQ